MNFQKTSVKYLRAHRTALLCTAGLFLFALLLNWLARNFASFGSWYNAAVYPLLPNTLGRLLSPLPFSLFEWLVFLALLAAGGFLLLSLISLWSCSGRRFIGRVLSRTVPILLCLAAALFFMQTLTCFLNYSRTDFSAELGVVTYPAGNQELTELCRLLISDLDKEISQSAVPGSRAENSFANADVEQEAKNAMKKLGQVYPSLSGYYPNPKPMFFSKAMSSLNLTGIFSPYTTEANYNKDVTPYVIPYTICHELAHVKGFIKENEAGFIAYLACAGSDSPLLRYSGALNALSYSLNALYRNVSAEDYQEVLRTVPARALRDLQTNQSYWQQFNGGVRGVISKTARAANDSYLRANAQTDGTKSYGRMVDLLLAYYKVGSEQL